MVSNQSQNRLQIRGLEQQLRAAAYAIPALTSDVLLNEVFGHAKRTLPKGYDGLLVTPLDKPYGEIGIPVACSAWSKASSGWGLQTKIPIEMTAFKFTHFKRDPRTQQAVDSLEKDFTREGNRLRVFAARVSYEEIPILQDGEFFLDVASTIWAFVTHPDWKVVRGEFLVRCLGEKYLPKKDLHLLIGYKQACRKITFREQITTPTAVFIGKTL